MAVYHATKAYVLSFSEALHSELAPTGVRVDRAVPRAGADRILRNAPAFRAAISRAYLARTAERVAREGYDGLHARQARGGAGNAEQGRNAAAAAVASRPIVLGMTGGRWRKMDRRAP